MCDKKTVCVVEAEKTAVIMSEVKPEYVWLATGGKTELNVAKLRPLEGRRIILFPDTVSTLLEQRATPAQKAAKIDLVDLLF